MRLIGETVVVLTPSDGSSDPFGAPVSTWTETTVTDVLVQPTSESDSTDSNRPEGYTGIITLHFPKTFTSSMRGKRVKVRGNTYSVVGDPQPYTAANTPTRWNYPVEVTRTDG